MTINYLEVARLRGFRLAGQQRAAATAAASVNTCAGGEDEGRGIIVQF